MDYLLPFFLNNRWKSGLQIGQRLIGQHVRRNGVKSLSARAKLEAVRAWASAEQLSGADVKKWALDYFGQRASYTVNDDGTTQSVAQQYLHEHSRFVDVEWPVGRILRGSVIA